MKTLFKNAKIYDGTANDPFIGDVLIEGEKILNVAENIEDKSANVVNLSGLSLSSGFIDAHSHNDWYAIKEEPVKYFEPFIRQGICSFITGNCGLSASGFNPDSKNKNVFGTGLFHYRNVKGIYGDVGDFFDAIDNNTPCNIATLVGHCTARADVAGLENRPLTEDEMSKMLNNVDKSLSQGACGISLGLMYSPGIYAPLDELKELSKLSIKHDKAFTVHPRASSKVSMAYPQLFGRSHLLRALDELWEIAKGTNLKLHYSHAIFVGRSTFPNIDEFVDIINKMKAEGINIGFDIYDEDIGTTVITVIMPPWYMALSKEDKRKPFNKLRFALLTKASILLLGFGFNDMTIAYVGEGNEQFEGKTVHQIAKELGVSDLDAYLHLCEISDFKGRINMGPYTTDEILRELSKHDDVLYMTDAWYEEKGVQNPALFDCFPKFLQHSLKGDYDTMPKTIRKMTAATADRFRLKDRGYIKPGYYADITIFDEAELLNGTPDIEKPFGINRVYINGKEVLNNGELNTEALKTSGKAMRVID
ncbi:MAG: amidohydrolase family protein [Christensenellaceae bacterium]|nr:amidohydrolase family protein [Christensenellaceae bacterium]